jgi:hypothetical protein
MYVCGYVCVCVCVCVCERERERERKSSDYLTKLDLALLQKLHDGSVFFEVDSCVTDRYVHTSVCVCVCVCVCVNISYVWSVRYITVSCAVYTHTKGLVSNIVV